MSFWKIYTPKNIFLESVHRLKGLKQRFHIATAPKTGSVPYDESHANKVGNFYDEYHDKFMRVYGNVIQAFRTRDVQHLLDYQIASMDLQPGQRILDAGCGVGTPALYFARHAGVEVDAITISTKQHETALANIQAEGLGQSVRVVRGDYHRMPEYFPAESYDVVCFLESFGHSRAKQHLLDVCWTMLKPGGLLYIKDLFVRIPLLADHKKKIAAEVLKINQAYQYDIADLNTVLNYIRGKGYILSSLKTIDLSLSEFEDLSISNEFQELTGIARIENWDEYIFPVEFFELKCLKPSYDIRQRLDRYFLQHLYHQQSGIKE